MRQAGVESSALHIRHVAVLIPARNEVALLPRCLRSVLQACDALPSTISTDIVVMVDSSSDGTAETAEKVLLGRGSVRSIDAGNVGYVRAAAADMALRAVSQRTRDLVPAETAACWLANTDADCEVPRTWLLHQVQAANAGADAVAGIVDVDCFAEHLPHVESRFRLTYKLHDDGTHPHVHGANLGVRASVYLRAGGWQGFETAEDHDLWQRVRAVTPNHVADSSLCVQTSGRRVGRAPRGFAGALAAHNDVPACLPLRAVAAGSSDPEKTAA